MFRGFHILWAWRARYLLKEKRAERRRLFKERRKHKPHSRERGDLTRKLRAITTEILRLEAQERT